MENYLFVVPSTCQMYSGTGTAIFDWIKYSKDIFRYSILMDNFVESNFDLTRQFCSDVGIEFIPSRPMVLPCCPDSGIAEIHNVLKARHFDFVECVSWANAGTNLAVLSALPADTHLVFTPHSQPMWTLGRPESFPLVPTVFKAMAARSDTLLLDSPVEQEMALFSGVPIRRAVHARLGVDTSVYRMQGHFIRNRNHVLCVCDFRESRKRFDYLLAGFSRALQIHPELTLVIAGKYSDAVPIPDSLESSVIRKGYVELSALVSLYNTAGQFCLVSDYEAFGLPIAEALCCGLPVVLNSQTEIVAIFDGLRGVSWVNNAEAESIASALVTNYKSDIKYDEISREAVDYFSLQTSCSIKLNALHT